MEAHSTMTANSPMSFKILKDHGFNYVRLRVFVNPSAPRGYASMSKEAFCDAAHTLAMAKRARAAGMGLLIDFHYSDTWADPGKQAKPDAWENLDFPALKQAVYDHTHSTLALFKQNGITPEMVQIGNETTNGMLWPDGRAKDHFDNFAELLKSGVAATRDVDPSIKIVLHHDKGTNNKVVRWWLDNLISRGVDFDIIGLSCNTDGPVNQWKENFNDLAVRYPQYGLIAAEYSYKKRELQRHRPQRPRSSRPWARSSGEPTPPRSYLRPNRPSQRRRFGTERLPSIHPPIDTPRHSRRDNIHPPRPRRPIRHQQSHPSLR